MQIKEYVKEGCIIQQGVTGGRLKIPWSSEEQIKYVHQLYLLSATWTMFCYLDLGVLQTATLQ